MATVIKNFDDEVMAQRLMFCCAHAGILATACYRRNNKKTSRVFSDPIQVTLKGHPGIGEHIQIIIECVKFTQEELEAFCLIASIGGDA